jgi:hypothetical protein
VAQQQEGILPFKSPNNGADIPHWDSVNRQLYFRGELVKAFTSPADYQEPILAAFEALGWPLSIDNPLPGDTQEERHLHLERAVRRLNGHQRKPSLRFHVRAAGKKVAWETFS